jgi:hypothetical protein
LYLCNQKSQKYEKNSIVCRFRNLIYGLSGIVGKASSTQASGLYREELSDATERKHHHGQLRF